MSDMIRHADAIALCDGYGITWTHDVETPTAKAIGDAIRALPAAQVAVKPLEWVYHGTVGATWAASAPFGAYVIIDLGGNWDADRFVLRLDQMRIDHFATAEAAKSAAQADYDARIRSALTVAPPTVADDVAAMPTTAAERDVLVERSRQCVVEGWTPTHDDEHDGSEMAIAAACYALSASGWSRTALWEIWPKAWGVNWFKPNYTSPRRDLVKAGALIIAEIERLDRAALAKMKGGA